MINLKFMHTYSKQKILNTFDDVKNQLVEPILEDQLLNELYWYTVETLFKHAKTNSKKSKLISNFQDTAFNENIFLWDSAFISRFTMYFDDYLPGIRTLDNFYASQVRSGLIPREINKITGEPYAKWINKDKLALHSFFHNRYRYRGLDNIKNSTQLKFYHLKHQGIKPPEFTLDALNHPILSYAEYEHFVFTGDKDRLYMIHDVLYTNFLSLLKYLKHDSNLFVTDWASMDNSPRNELLYLGVDTSSEMVLFAKDLIKIYKILDEKFYNDRISLLEHEVKLIEKAINDFMWDKEKKFYFDLDDKLCHINIKTIAGFWPLLAEITNDHQCDALCDWLRDAKTFNRVNVVPSLAANETKYNPDGGYWRGGVWASTNLMVTDGLERNRKHELAKEIAIKYLMNIKKVYQKTKTLWEVYAPDSVSQGDSDHRDFVGWTGIAPIHYLIKYYLGFSYNSIINVLTWEINLDKQIQGLKKFKFGKNVAHFQAMYDDNLLLIDIETLSSFDLILKLDHKLFTYHINHTQHIEIKAKS